MFGYDHYDHEDDLRSRQRCTDCPCCVAFVFLLAVFGGMYMKVMSEGNIGRLYHGIDYTGQVCGVDEKVQNSPYLYWCMKSQLGGVPKLSMDHPICVAHCPGSGTIPVPGSTSNMVYEPEPDCAAVAGAEGMTSYRTTLVLNRFCLPDPKAYPEVSEQLSANRLSDSELFVTESLSSISSAWPVLVGSFFVAVMMGYLYLVLLRHCAEPLIYMTMLLCVVGFAVLGVYLFANAGSLSTQVSASMQTTVQLPKDFTENETTITKIAAGICFVLSFFAVCLGCCFHHSISVGSACVEVACDTMFEMPSLLLLPVLKAFFKGILSLVLLLGFIELYSTSDISDGSDGTSPHFTHSQEQTMEILFYLLMSYWILAFVNALYQFIVAYAVADYYYTPYDHDHEKDVGCCAIWDGVYFGLLLHGGSLALGSLLIATLLVIQKVVEYVQAKNQQAGDNKVVDCLLCCCLCCVHCCKEMVEFINKNAYIDIAVTSNGFCTAAKSALEMITELGGAMAILNGATFVFTIFGTILISLGCGWFTYVVSSQGTFADQSSEFEVSNPMAPMAVGCMIGMLVALSFMHIFDMTSDTLLYCYGFDKRNHKPANTAPPALKGLVNDCEH